MRIDIKDERAKITISLVGYQADDYYSSIGINYPFDKEANSKDFFGQGFAESCKRANESLSELEKTLRQGSDTDRDW